MLIVSYTVVSSFCCNVGTGINEKVVNDGGHLPHHHGFQYVGINYPYGQNWKCDPKKVLNSVA